MPENAESEELQDPTLVHVLVVADKADTLDATVGPFVGSSVQVFGKLRATVIHSARVRPTSKEWPKSRVTKKATGHFLI